MRSDGLAKTQGECSICGKRIFVNSEIKNIGSNTVTHHRCYRLFITHVRKYRPEVADRFEPEKRPVSYPREISQILDRKSKRDEEKYLKLEQRNNISFETTLAKLQSALES